MKRLRTGLIFGAALYGVAWAAGASLLWCVVVGLAAAAVAASLV
ncbi:hypothetical protein O3Q52_41640 [Streptomyces sp. ActVer]|nr:hypothetical protein [Streptomyces sp. ActVer]MCZ4514528.1 hypothetical protein [Streptomyces sp. ActVer]